MNVILTISDSHTIYSMPLQNNNRIKLYLQRKKETNERNLKSACQDNVKFGKNSYRLLTFRFGYVIRVCIEVFHIFFQIIH